MTFEGGDLMGDQLDDLIEEMRNSSKEKPVAMPAKKEARTRELDDLDFETPAPRRTKRRTLNVPAACLVLSGVLFVVGLVMFQIGFDQYSDAYFDRITADTQGELSNALWMDRHAKIVMHDALMFIGVAFVLFMAAIGLYVSRA